MRRWEYVEGGASKFWETGSDEAVVTVRYGRCGSEGRTQTKEYGSAEAADAQVAKSIAEKERKGYREVGAPAPSGGGTDAAGRAQPGGAAGDPAAPPDEDTFVMPAGWRRLLHPRRGGVARTPARAQKAQLDAVEARTAEEKAWIQRFLDAPASDAGLVELTRLHLAGSPSPAGAAAVAAIVGLVSPPAGAWADSWVRLGGLPFAARAAVELFLTEAHWTQYGGRREDPWLEPRRHVPQAYWTRSCRPAADRVRMLLAAADEETYRATVEVCPAAGPTPTARSSRPTWRRARPTGSTGSARIPKSPRSGTTPSSPWCSVRSTPRTRPGPSSTGPPSVTAPP
ncbi:WGR domain-containing protein [Streptomyces sp. A0642]|uniref:WGR domain-containing protein n=1 Tax=Streptomyces sp. A0642 TaxID=2563100 RepID=UPI001F119310|nr:WGR domain-containing protein [Streptomyces sp. A0642]